MAKQNLTIVAVGDALEASAVRATLEGFNYRTTTHWVGSRAELLKLLAGEIPTDNDVILSCHGDDRGILVPDEPPITPAEVRDHAHLDGKTVINLGCRTGAGDLPDAFRSAGTAAYVAPIDYPDGSAALAFVNNLYFLRTYDIPLDQAVQHAAAVHPECGQFQLHHA
ncbi:hypothetical protein [Kribbella solani]|uniref:Uncharacterized protein n=1 Tax=Kribbella solani TaxID=236067 RepID=A0A841DS92_9ACTN|nr:hypothetical protein [Kribbella solani]MBB5979590.1 hypothetical protein [Kribbella solani]